MRTNNNTELRKCEKRARILEMRCYVRPASQPATMDSHSDSSDAAVDDDGWIDVIWPHYVRLRCGHRRPRMEEFAQRALERASREGIARMSRMIPERIKEKTSSVVLRT